ncbi:hypothetical protein EJ05DRAFT_206022 [Pseudovirgaria hyperparasitica]|uniref:Low temperature requirement A n=1 Tax=Pseudovirgaria hyperparasitica TaxID=470096 RepID=A0A6A6WK45_9PEZI|nr:uncharacterized protein EJ05DRAFT_206022 [Pseudovirgaria hyperparasitica]KAF2762331.1 hypothetical protein EJ05DRAFT_206022 [Pseudovirgaria hyperparasitica]
MAHSHEEHHHEEEEKLRFFSSPLKHEPASLPRHESKISDEENRKDGPHTTNNEIPWNRDGQLHESPEFHRHEAAQSIELFYDLFFVANLTTFTANHNINTVRTLSSYVGFFCILWFTWYQSTLYDVRFAVDNVVERVFKLVNFGVMMGLAAVGSGFDPDDTANKWKTFRELTLILMVSRLTLVAQYSFTLFWTRKYRQIVLPLLMVIAMSFIASMVYLGLYFAFQEGKDTNAYVAWYIVAVLETVLTTCVSMKWRVISFKGTHIQERLSLLTLIILGEGIILLCKSISYIIKGSWVFTSDTIGSIIAALLIIYGLYQVYFDRVVEHHFGTIRQQIWSFAHFPMHIALVLALEGTRQFVIWRQAIPMVDTVYANVFQWDFTVPQAPEVFESAITTIWDYAVYSFSFVKDADISSTNQTVYDSLATIANLTNTADLACNEDFTVCTDDVYTIDGALFDIFVAITKFEFDLLGIKAPKPKGDKKPTQSDVITSYSAIFDMIFTYFFITAGLTLILIGMLHWIATPPKKLGDYLRGGSNFVIGLGLCLLSTMSLARSPDTYGSVDKYQYGSWVLSTFVFALFANVVLNHVRRPAFMTKTHN